MKKFFILMLLAIVSIGGVYAQTDKGSSSIGLSLGYGFDSGPDNATIGLDYRYCILDNFRIAPSLTYHIKDSGFSSWAIDANAHYVFRINDMFGFYPLAGLNLSFWRFSLAGVSDTMTRFGVNIGLGGEVYATDRINVGLEFKYLALKDFGRPALAVRVGYCF